MNHEIKNTYICPLCGSKTKDYFLVMGSPILDSASDIKCSNKRCFFSSNYVPYRIWQHIADLKKNELLLQHEVKRSNKAEADAISDREKMMAERNFLQADIDALQARIAELEAENKYLGNMPVNTVKAPEAIIYDNALDSNRELRITVQRQQDRIAELEAMHDYKHLLDLADEMAKLQAENAKLVRELVENPQGGGENE